MIVSTARRATYDTDEAKTPKQLTRTSLFVMGAVFCGIELTGALPYFGFLTLISAYGLSVPLVVRFFALYTLGYSAPLIALYFAYSRLRGTQLIVRMERVLSRVSAYIVPGALALMGVVLAYFGAGRLLA